MASYGQRDRMASEKDAVIELVRRWNEGNLDITDERANKLAEKAYNYGIDFDPSSRPISKGLFDLADTASFGLVPNSWRPESVGQEYFGESGIDKFAGGVGTVAGLFPAGAGLLKGAKMISKPIGSAASNLWKGMRGGGGSSGGGNSVQTAVATMKELTAKKRADGIASQFYLGEGQRQLGSGALRLGEGQRRLGAGAPRLNAPPLQLGAPAYRSGDVQQMLFDMSY